MAFSGVPCHPETRPSPRRTATIRSHGGSPGAKLCNRPKLTRPDTSHSLTALAIAIRQSLAAMRFPSCFMASSEPASSTGDRGATQGRSRSRPRCGSAAETEPAACAMGHTRVLRRTWRGLHPDKSPGLVPAGVASSERRRPINPARFGHLAGCASLASKPTVTSPAPRIAHTQQRRRSVPAPQSHLARSSPARPNPPNPAVLAIRRLEAIECRAMLVSL